MCVSVKVNFNKRSVSREDVLSMASSKDRMITIA